VYFGKNSFAAGMGKAKNSLPVKKLAKRKRTACMDGTAKY